MDKRITPDICAAARESMAKTGIPASITVSQWALESGYGAHVSGKNNCFGIKAVAGQACTTRTTQECVRGVWETIPQHFADYPTLAAGFAAHAHLLATGTLYAEARKQLPDALRFGAAMAKRYATDPHYWVKLLSIINANDLLALDGASGAVARAEPRLAEVVGFSCKVCGRSEVEARAHGCGAPETRTVAAGSLAAAAGVEVGSKTACPMQALPSASAAAPEVSLKVGPTVAPAAPAAGFTGLFAHLRAWLAGRAAA